MHFQDIPKSECIDASPSMLPQVVLGRAETISPQKEGGREGGGAGREKDRSGNERPPWLRRQRANPISLSEMAAEMADKGERERTHGGKTKLPARESPATSPLYV